ncbi:TetR/AcrR family transcriptional regulator [Mycobacterium hubeiense]|uniref:TetR/AcrR family transcriptional regulator n=1 Tax=Mycobacterium hubeiense TaxID=1867256 RepID=UPI000C7EF8A4|nr:TetR/AcrR family transcriptional regulator [Mycobacterium sp. QGD 101]
MDAAIVRAAIEEAEQTATPVAELSLDRIARRAGVSRSTIYRRVRSREALNEAVRKAGADPGSRVGVRERAVAAATEIILADGVAALTVEGVARRVGCAVSSVHTTFGGRAGLLAAVFERHAPLPIVEQLIQADPKRFSDFETGVRTIYTVVFDAVADDTGVLEAMVAEALGSPNGIGMAFVREQIAPRIAATVGTWLQEQIRAGHCIDLPLSMLVPLLIAPISVHLIARQRLAAAGQPVPDRQTVIDTMTTAFCRAVETTSTRHRRT